MMFYTINTVHENKVATAHIDQHMINDYRSMSRGGQATGGYVAPPDSSHPLTFDGNNPLILKLSSLPSSNSPG
jgi:hypothetical protein